jgi:ribose transport system ATP-binding protein
VTPAGTDDAGGEVILALSRVSKHFAGVHALRGVDLTVCGGEVRALVGANGSGKSTLVKILAGYHQPEPGAAISLRGRPRRFSELSRSQQRLGIGVVHQDLGLIEELSVLENFLLPRFAASQQWYIDWKKARRDAAPFLARFGVSSLAAKVAEVPRVTRALLALGRAVRVLESSEGQSHGGQGGGILVLDEITAFLSAEEVHVLHQVVRETAQKGHGVLFISHDLGEVLSFADAATVLRDGAVVAQRTVADTSAEMLFELITGRGREQVVPSAVATPDHPAAVRLADIGVAGAGRASFSIAPGEVVGLTGLLGSGFEEIPYVLFGARHDAVGTLSMGGQEISLDGLSIRRAISKGIAFVPGDRLGAGLIDSLSIAENMTMLKLPSFVEHGALAWRRVRAYAREIIKRYRIVAHSENDGILTLSGGNQQRVLLSKWLEENSSLLLLHDPVRGVDVGARIEIARLVRTHATEGAAVICASSDYEFLSEVCDRVLVCRNGDVVEELVRQSGELIPDEAIEWACLNKGATTIVIESDAAEVEV